LISKDKLVREGCIVDTTIISSYRHPHKTIDVFHISEDRQKESSSGDDASWVIKGNRPYYGYKGHFITDCRSGFILSSHVTSAHHSDMGEFKSLARKGKLPDKSRVYADKGYASRDNRSF